MVPSTTLWGVNDESNDPQINVGCNPPRKRLSDQQLEVAGLATFHFFFFFYPFINFILYNYCNYCLIIFLLKNKHCIFFLFFYLFVFFFHFPKNFLFSIFFEFFFNFMFLLYYIIIFQVPLKQHITINGHVSTVNYHINIKLMALVKYLYLF